MNSSKLKTWIVTGAVAFSGIFAAFAIESPTPAKVKHFESDNANVRKDIDNIQMDKEHIRFHKAEIKDQRMEDDKIGVVAQKKELKKAKADLKKDKKYLRADKKDLKKDHKISIREQRKELREAKRDLRRDRKAHMTALKKGSDAEVSRTYAEVTDTKDRVQAHETAMVNQKAELKEDMAAIKADEKSADNGESVYYARLDRNGKYNGIFVDDDDDDRVVVTTTRTNGSTSVRWYRK